MKNILLIFALIVSTTTFAQEEWGDMKGNKLTMNEIAPVWPGCSGSIAAKKSCFTKNLNTHVVKNFKYPMAEFKKNIEGRVVVDFMINVKGLPEIKSVTGGNKGLQEEARRNIMLLPKMKPGMLGGKPRAINYKVPFNFKTGK
jgi:protein TonB